MLREVSPFISATNKSLTHEKCESFMKECLKVEGDFGNEPLRALMKGQPMRRRLCILKTMECSVSRGRLMDTARRKRNSKRLESYGY